MATGNNFDNGALVIEEWTDFRQYIDGTLDTRAFNYVIQGVAPDDQFYVIRTDPVSGLPLEIVLPLLTPTPSGSDQEDFEDNFLTEAERTPLLRAFGVSEILINDSSDKTISGVQIYDRDNGGILAIAGGNAFPSSPVPRELFWREDLATLFRRNDANDAWQSASAAPVTAVNGETGIVVLDAADVGADPAGTAVTEAANAVTAHEGEVDPHPQYTTGAEAASAAPVQSVNGDTGAVVLDAADVGADPAGTGASEAASAVSTHEAAGDPHPGYVLESREGVSNGVATLDGTGNVPFTQLGNVVGGLTYLGTWDASTNSPTITNGTGDLGDFYRVATAGTTNIDGINDWGVGDWIIFDGAAWQKLDNTDQVSSVFGRTGSVVAAASDYSADQVDYDNATSGLAATNVQAAIDENDTRLDAVENVLNTNFLQVRQTAPQTIAGVYTTLTFGSTDVETDSSKITLNVDDETIEMGEDSVYLISISARIDATSLNVDFEIRARLNGTTTLPGSETGDEDVDGEFRFITRTFAGEFVDGDEITFQAIQSDGGSNEITIEANVVVASFKGIQGDPGPPGAPGAGSTVLVDDEGSAVPSGPFDTLDFVGAGVVASDGGGGVATITVDRFDQRISAYNTTTATFTGTTTIPLNATNVIDGGAFSIAGNQITVVEAGRYDIDAAVSLRATGSSSRTQGASWLEVNNSEVAGTRGEHYMRQTDFGATASRSITLDLSAGDTIRQRAVRTQGGASVLAVTNGSRIRIRRVS